MRVAQRLLWVMQLEQPAIWLISILVSIGFAYTDIGDRNVACSGKLERALDALYRNSARRNLNEEKVATAVATTAETLSYRRELYFAPLEMLVSRMAIKLPEEETKEAIDERSHAHWAQVERCIYEPERNSLKTRVIFNDLSVSGMVSLMPRDNYHPPIPVESCRMTLRLRRAGIDFFTNPIARGRGQMRIRTESSFLEPRFASIYVYGCRPIRLDKQIKRQDKWPSYHAANGNGIASPPPSPPLRPQPLMPSISFLNDKYDAAEPRHLASTIVEEADLIPIRPDNESQRYSHVPEINFGVWKINSWITKLLSRQRRSTQISIAAAIEPGNHENYRSSITQNISREVKETLLHHNNLDNLFPTDSENPHRSWQSKERITREIEDVFLQGASQALTRYIERQLHPAIKETLMLSMGYTISYG